MSQRLSDFDFSSMYKDYCNEHYMKGSLSKSAVVEILADNFDNFEILKMLKEWDERKQAS